MAKRSSKNVLTVPKFVKDLTTNKYVLYVVAFFAVVNVLGYMAMGKNICVLLFILIAAITSYFSKNMIFVLAVPTFLVGFFAICDTVKSSREGMEDNSESTDNSEAKFKVDDIVISNDSEGTKGKVASVTDKEVVIETDDGEEVTVSVTEMGDWKVDSGDVESMDETIDETIDETGDVTPSEDTTKNKDTFRSAGKKGDRIDYATTLDDAYSNLNNILGKDGIKNLTSDTQALMKQQLQLASAMKGMQPLIGQAKDMMNSLGEFGDLGKLTGGLGK